MARVSTSTSPRRPYAARVSPAVRREQLLDAAIAIIVRDGYDKVSIDAIAREAGVTRPVVYGVYDGLGALLDALLDRHEKRALKQLAAALPADLDLTDPDEYLLQAARAMAETIREDPWTWRPILLGAASAPAALQQRIELDKALVRREIAGLLEVGLAVRGGPKLDAEVMAHAVLAMLEHFGRTLLEEPATFEVDQLIEAFRQLLKAFQAA